MTDDTADLFAQSVRQGDEVAADMADLFRRVAADPSRDLLTPNAVAKLVGVGLSAVRNAVATGRLEWAGELNLGKETRLYRPADVLACWPDAEGFADTLAQIKTGQIQMSIGDRFWNLISCGPIVEFSEATRRVDTDGS